VAIDSYMTFKDYSGNYLQAESQVDLGDLTRGLPEAKSTIGAAPAGSLFEVNDYSFDIEQQLNIGSQSSGAGAGKVTFNPFSITRKIDKSSPKIYQMACSGTPFQEVCLGMRKSAGGDTTGVFFLLFRFMLVAVKTISWAHDDESPNETCTFEYGGLQMFYAPQDPSGKVLTTVPGGWNRVKNTASFQISDKIGG
jgi:type VI secretion system secreted protein Hcp